MPRVEICTRINAELRACFDLARDIDFHQRSLQHTGERAIAGVTSGLIGPGESVTWQARHLGVTQKLTSQITAFNPPDYFQDTMTRGAFKRMVHDHHFEPSDTGTVMRDVIDFASPFGPLGKAVDRLYLTRYMHRLISLRALAIKAEAETKAHA